MENTFGVTYATVATGLDLPGAEITDTHQERAEARTRELLIETNEANEIVTFQTESGITVEVMQSGLGDNAVKPMEVDQEALEVNLNFIIDSLDNLNQDVVSQEDIEKFQQKAAVGELDHVTFTLITSFDGRHCVDNNGRTFSEVYGTDDCAAYGIAHTNPSRFEEETRGTINPTLLVAPSKKETRVTLEAPEDYSIDPDKLFDAPVTHLIDLRRINALASTGRHELAHGVMSVLDPGIDAAKEHELFVDPLTQAGDTLMLGWVDNYETNQLPLPFTAKHS